MTGGKDYTSSLLRNIHHGLNLPNDVTDVHLIAGEYLYYHYGCDGFDDRGWGCGYRTLMTLCSWIRDQKCKDAVVPLKLTPVPSNKRIQEILVEIGDKEENFIGSRQWIGSVEVGFILDTLYDVPCKIIHVNSGAELTSKLSTLTDHFRCHGSPIMMGGETDVSSKGIMGVALGPVQSYLLIVDPHFWGVARDISELQNKGWAKWQPLADFHLNTFYNLCLPQYTAKSLKPASRN